MVGKGLRQRAAQSSHLLGYYSASCGYVSSLSREGPASGNLNGYGRWGEVRLRSGFSSILTRLWARGHEVDREKYAGYVVDYGGTVLLYTALVFIETLFPS